MKDLGNSKCVGLKICFSMKKEIVIDGENGGQVCFWMTPYGIQSKFHNQ